MEEGERIMGMAHAAGQRLAVENMSGVKEKPAFQ